MLGGLDCLRYSIDSCREIQYVKILLLFLGGVRESAFEPFRLKTYLVLLVTNLTKRTNLVFTFIKSIMFLVPIVLL